MKYLLFTILFFIGCSIYAQNSNDTIYLKGVVMIAEDSCGIPGAIVKAKGTDNETFTDFYGNFNLKYNKKDAQSIVVSFTGRISQEIFIYESTDSLRIYLKKEDVDIDHVIAKKPILYFYPEQETTIDIKLNFNGKVQNTYPKYNNGWKVLAKPNGDLINLQDNSKHRYLFWDGINANNYQISEFNAGFVVPKNETLKFLDSTLSKIGLTDYEKNDFITFWLPEMNKNDYNFVHFLINENCDEIATLNVNPKPDSEVRVYMAFAKVDESYKVKQQSLKTIDRSGFVLVEWGGFEIVKKTSN